MLRKKKDKEVEKDVVDWTLVTRNTKQRRRTIKIFVKMGGCRTIMMEVAPTGRS